MLKPNTKLIILIDPNNPLGKLISTETLYEISSMCHGNKYTHTVMRSIDLYFIHYHLVCLPPRIHLSDL